MFNRIKNLFKSKIDALVDEKGRLKIEAQNVKDRMHERNSNIETKLKKLENKAFILKETADKKIAEINRRLSKINRDIESEKLYVNSIGEEQKEKK